MSELAKTVPCLWCAAQPGQPCREMSAERRVRVPHRARGRIARAARRAGLLPTPAPHDSDREEGK